MNNMKNLFLVVVVFTTILSCQTQNSRIEIFENVCNVFQENYYDETFATKDWDNIKQVYREKIKHIKTDEEFYELLNEMFFKFDVSHLGVFYPNMPDPLFELANKEGGIGITLKVIENKIAVINVKENSPAESAGIKRGDIILSIDGFTLDDVIDESKKFPYPPYNERNIISNYHLRAQYRTYGDVGEPLQLVFETDDGSRNIELVRVERGGKVTLVDGTPPNFLEFVSRLINTDIGYIRFNTFAPDLLDKILNAVDELTNAKGLIIDIRDNPGGFFQVRKALADKLALNSSLLWSQDGRRGSNDIYLEPAAKTYRGKIAILIDVSSASSSEEFAGGLQALGRAVVIGEHTQGRVLIADFQELAPGVMFMYPVAITSLSNGKTLEGKGVVPDIIVEHTLKSLREGKDIQLESAINYLLSQIQ